MNDGERFRNKHFKLTSMDNRCANFMFGKEWSSTLADTVEASNAWAVKIGIVGSRSLCLHGEVIADKIVSSLNLCAY